MTDCAYFFSALLVLRRQILAGVDDDRQLARTAACARTFSISSMPSSPGQHQVDAPCSRTRRSRAPRAPPRRCAPPSPRRRRLRRPARRCCLALRVVVLDQQQPAHRPIEEGRDVLEGALERLLADRLLEVGERAQRGAAPCSRSIDRDDVHRDVARARVALQAVEHRPAVQTGQLDVERDRVGLVARWPAPGRCRRGSRPPP